MQSHVWAALAQQIPVAVVDKFSIVTLSGAEIALQAILRIERDFLIVKGRLSGSQEAGRVFFVPYAQIDYLGSLQPFKETEYEELFGGMIFPDAAPVPEGKPASVEMAPSPSSLNLPSPAAAGAAPGSYGALPTPGSGPRQAIKSAVLERFRARNGNSSGPPSPRPE
jgi:hypothetical protein